MKKLNAFIIFVVLALVIVLIFMYNYIVGIIFLMFLILLEIGSQIFINKLREDFQWLITSRDELPSLDKDGINRFFAHGFDPELGWVRKSNTEKEEIGKLGVTKYHIDSDGARRNPSHDNLARKISCFGDSFVFSRQVNDNETWEWYLSELTESNVMNFGVGNYGLDQALLYLKRVYSKNKTKVVMMGVVPSTIVRVLCIWKHYNEFGNTFGFKPRYVLKDDTPYLIENIINDKKKFENYKRYLPIIRKLDYFYKSKFKREMITFPYLVSILSDAKRNLPIIFYVCLDKLNSRKNSLETYPPAMKVIMDINLKLRYKIFKKDENAIRLLEKLVLEFSNYGKKEKFIPIFVWMPQKDDLISIRKKKNSYYSKFIQNIKEHLFVIDLTPHLIKRDDLDDLYSDDNQYGGHYSKAGNKIIAEIINKEMMKVNEIKQTLRDDS